MLQKNGPTSSLPHAMRGLQTAPSQMKRTRFYVEDILRPDFGTTKVDTGCTQVRSTKDLPTPLINEGEESHPRDPEKGGKERQEGERGKLWPAWVYCTRYSDRPSSGPRTRKVRKKEGAREEKRPRTAFSPEQLERLREEFTETQYLSEDRRRLLASQLNLNEAQIKIWFQNKRAKMKKTSPIVNPLALKLRQEGLYNHSAGNHGDS